MISSKQVSVILYNSIRGPKDHSLTYSRDVKTPAYIERIAPTKINHSNTGNFIQILIARVDGPKSAYVLEIPCRSPTENRGSTDRKDQFPSPTG